MARGADLGFVGWQGFGGVDAFEQVAVTVEEGAVDSAGAMPVTLSSAPSLTAVSSAESTR